jgi:threonine synthase
MQLGAVNSINWARVMAQITYYFYAWLRVTDPGQGHHNAASGVSFAVPTGNFGDILAGYYAKRMGLPVDSLIVCTNENDVLHRFLQTGAYTRLPAVSSIAPSMDISVSSNFERYLYYLADENGDTLAEWMRVFESTGELVVPPAALSRAVGDFLSFSADRRLILQTMRELYVAERYLVCPHTATAVAAVQRLQAVHDVYGTPPTQYVCLATAHPAKFEAATQQALQGDSEPRDREHSGHHAAAIDIPHPPMELAHLRSLPTHCKTHVPNDLLAVQAYMREKSGVK